MCTCASVSMCVREKFKFFNYLICHSTRSATVTGSVCNTFFTRALLSCLSALTYTFGLGGTFHFEFQGPSERRWDVGHYCGLRVTRRRDRTYMRYRQTQTQRDRQLSRLPPSQPAILAIYPTTQSGSTTPKPHHKPNHS